MKIIKIIFVILLTIITSILVYINISLFYKPVFVDVGSYEYNQDLLHQLNYLKQELHSGAGDKMQSVYPEGFVFINSLYGLSWCGFLENIDHGSELYQNGLKEINWAIDEIESEQAKSRFNKNLPLEYGVFYQGWKNYLLARKLQLQTIQERDSQEVAKFMGNCELLTSAWSEQDNSLLESYNNGCWPADNLIAIASLNTHDKIFNSKYHSMIQDWLAKVRGNLDTKTGLIPHRIDSKTMRILEGARGSSQSLMLNFLPEIDADFAKDQFELYKHHYVDDIIEFTVVRGISPRTRWQWRY
jgi:hypothetical protein